MTTDVLDPATITYTVSGTGPYNIDNDYGSAADFVVSVIDADDVETVLPVSDWSIAPLGPATTGDLTLEPAAATTYDGYTIQILRVTEVEQGWAGENAREVGLESQLDRITWALQEGQRDGARALRVRNGPTVDYEPADGHVPIWDAARGGLTNGPTSDEIANAQANADAAIAARAGAETAAAAAAIHDDGLWVDDAALLPLDTAITYTAGQPGTVVAGDYVQARAQGISYKVADPAAVDHDMTTAGGAKLYYVWDGRAEIPAAAFGCAKTASNAENTAALQAAVDFASDMAPTSDTEEVALSVVLDPSWTLVITDTIWLKSGAGIVSGSAGPKAKIKIDPTADFSAKRMFDTIDGAAKSLKYIHLVGLTLIGNGVDLLGYIRLSSGLRPRVKDVNAVGGCAEHGLVTVSGCANGVFRDLYIKDCWHRALTGGDGYVGAFDIDGSDHFISNVYGNIGTTGTGDTFTDGRKCGVRLAGSIARVSEVRGEASETGIVVDGADRLNAAQLTADYNYGCGVIFTGTATQNNVGQIEAFGNGRAATDTYDGVKFEAGQNHDNVIGQVTIGTRPSVSELMRDAVRDDATPSAGHANRIGLIGGYGWTGARLHAEDAQAPVTPHLDGPTQAFADGDATPDVSNGNRFRLVNSSAITITGLDNMPRGKSVRILCSDTTGAETTISSADFVLPGSADIQMVRGRTYEFYRDYDGNVRLIQAAPVVREFKVSTGTTLDFDGSGGPGDAAVVSSLAVAGLKADWPINAYFKSVSAAAASPSGSARNVDIEVTASATSDDVAYVRFVNSGAATRLSISTLVLSQSVPTV